MTGANTKINMLSFLFKFVIGFLTFLDQPRLKLLEDQTLSSVPARSKLS